MSYHLAAWAMDVDVPPREKLLLILIASHANDEGECFPSQTTLAYRSGLSRRTVLRSLAELEERGVITRRQRRRPDGSRSSDTIRLNVHGAPVRPPLAGGNLTDGARVTFPPQGDSVSPGGDSLTRHGDSVSPHGDNDDTARCPVVTAEPVIEPISEPVRESSAADAAAQQPGPSASTARGTRLTDDDFEQWWQGYPRKENKGRARTAFKTALKKATVKQLTDGRDAYAARINAERTETKYIAHASSWLNGERWADETPNPAKPATPHRITGRMDF